MEKDYSTLSQLNEALEALREHSDPEISALLRAVLEANPGAEHAVLLAAAECGLLRRRADSSGLPAGRDPQEVVHRFLRQHKPFGWALARTEPYSLEHTAVKEMNQRSFTNAFFPPARSSVFDIQYLAELEESGQFGQCGGALCLIGLDPLSWLPLPGRRWRVLLMANFRTSGMFGEVDHVELIGHCRRADELANRCIGHLQRCCPQVQAELRLSTRY